MYDKEGHVIWHELHTRKRNEAVRFYTSVVGWTSKDASVGGVTYRMLEAADAPVSAVIESSSITGWVAYIGVEDVEAKLEQIVRLGGIVVDPPTDAPAIGRFAIVRDPQGAPFGLFSPEVGNRTRSYAMTGHFAWHELYASDPDEAFDFYANVFDWKEVQVFDMGAGGTYRVFSVGGRPSGGIMRMSAAVSRPQWNPFVQVGQIDLVEEKIKSADGKVFNGMREVPGGNWTVKGIDSEGSMFAMSGPRLLHPPR